MFRFWRHLSLCVKNDNLPRQARDTQKEENSSIRNVATASSGELYPHPPILRGVPQADTLARAAELVAAAGGAPFGPPSSDDMAVAAAAADQQEEEQEEEEDGAVAWPVERDLCAKL